MSHELNLAQRPFLNPRPVLRVTILLWVLGVAVAAFNVRLYFSHYSGSSAIRERQQQLEESLERERGAVAELQAELARYDLELQNEQATFLNAKIAERSFSWSTLFDRLGEVMPADVRLSSLSPSFGGERARGRSETRENEVLLGIRGTATSAGVVLEFVDALFGHPSFRAPNLISESLQDNRLIDFSLSVIYEAREAEAEPTEETEVTAEAGDLGAAAAADNEEAAGEAAEDATGDTAPGKPSTEDLRRPAQVRKAASG